MSSSYDRLFTRINSRTARVGVVGLGYVGLPLAAELSGAGFDTTGIDLDANKVSAVNRGISYIPDLPTPDLEALVNAGRLRASSDFSSSPASTR